jgi:hypothetical protein
MALTLSHAHTEKSLMHSASGAGSSMARLSPTAAFSLATRFWCFITVLSSQEAQSRYVFSGSRLWHGIYGNSAINHK